MISRPPTNQGSAPSISEPTWSHTQRGPHELHPPATNLNFLLHRQLPPTVADHPSTSQSLSRIHSPEFLLTSSPEMSSANTGKKTRSAIQDVVSREYTINLHKRVC